MEISLLRRSLIWAITVWNTTYMCTYYMLQTLYEPCHEKSSNQFSVFPTMPDKFWPVLVTSNSLSRGIVLCSIKKVLRSCAIAAQLIYTWMSLFLHSYAKNRFTQDKPHLMLGIFVWKFYDLINLSTCPKILKSLGRTHFDCTCNWLQNSFFFKHYKSFWHCASSFGENWNLSPRPESNTGFDNLWIMSVWACQ